MFKKVFSLVVLVIFSFVLLPVNSFAADVPEENLANLQLSVSGAGTTSAFDPSLSQTLTSAPNFNTTNFSGLSNSTGYVRIKQGTVVVKDLVTWTNASVPTATITWNGMDINATTEARTLCGNTNLICPVGDYQVELHVEYVSGSDTINDTDSAAFTLVNSSALAVQSFTVTSSSNSTTTFDPSSSGGNEDLNMNFTLNKVPTSVTVEILDPDNRLLRTISGTAATSGQISWDGTYSNKLVVPGSYTLKLSASKTGEPTAISTKTIAVAYPNSNKGDIESISATPTSFDPDVDDTVIKFTNTADSNLTVEIKDSNFATVKTFSSFNDTNYSSSTNNSIVWNGRNDSGNIVSVGNYKAVIISRNAYGVVKKEVTIAINDTAGSISSSNAHIDDINFKPSSKFNPGEDDDLQIEFDVKTDLDELKIYAVRGTQEIEILNETDVTDESNREVTWDGRDEDSNDDEFVTEGTWRIEFRTKVGSTELRAMRTIKVEYDKPKIDEIRVSKEKFDNDREEFTSIMFKLDSNADVDILVVEDGRDSDDIVEDMEVEKDKWYAVEWDGDDYDYSDNVDIKVVAKNTSNADVFDSKKVNVDLAEDKTSSSKPNIVNDFISPVISNGNESMELSYELINDADVKVTIHKGTSGSGSEVIELVDVQDQVEGEHTLTWNGKDKNGKKLSDGYYSYKILADDKSRDTETGIFVVGDLGDIDGRASSSSDSNDDEDNNDNVNPGVIIDGGDDNDSDSSDNDTDNNNDDNSSNNNVSCAGFYDVPANSSYCDAITWAKNAGIVQGYPDGTFKPGKAINRVELLKVIFEAIGINPSSTASGNLGFNDVESNAWYVPYIKSGKDLGIFQGDAGKKTARPGDYVNRVEALKMAFESLKTKGFVLNGCSDAQPDAERGSWYYKYACGSQEYELFDGTNLSPAAIGTRGEIIQMLFRLSELGFL